MGQPDQDLNVNKVHVPKYLAYLISSKVECILLSITKLSVTPILARAECALDSGIMSLAVPTKAIFFPRWDANFREL